MIETQEGKTVFAVASGRGVAGVSIIRISGPQCRQVLESFVGFVPEARKAGLCQLHMLNSNEVIDHALVLWFPAPSSYTGEDVAEFHVHGSAAVIKLLFAELTKIENLVSAQPGVFTRRAFLNGKMDLTEIEGLADLIHAETEYQRQLALRNYQGFGSRQYTRWREVLKGCLAHMEACIDFSEEELDAGIQDQINAKMEILIREIEASVHSAIYSERLRNGYRIVLAGDVNVGKSTLLNMLARRDVAIVSRQPGTTRDILEVHLDLKGMPVIISDTAGLRKTDGAIENEGIRRAVDHIRHADLVLHICDRFSSETNREVEQYLQGIRAIRVWNKIDLGNVKQSKGDFAISAKTGQGLEQLLEFVARKAGEGLERGIESVVIRERHKVALLECVEALKESKIFGDGQFDLKVESMRHAMGKLGTIVGKVGVEDLLDVIFSDFCIGK